nr:hypothetical protein BaRGS_004863 [Batillaria attramentaria]
MSAVEFLAIHNVTSRKSSLPAISLVEHVETVRTQAGAVSARAAEPVQWRGHGGRHPTNSSVEFDRQLDKISIWLEQWDHDTRCAVLEAILRRSNYTQFQFLYTVMQPSLHRDFMYTANTRFPDIEFKPISTHISRELKDKLSRLRLDTFHRVKSAYLQTDNGHTLKLPSLDAPDTHITKSPYKRFIEMPVRRHIQDEKSPRRVHSHPTPREPSVTESPLKDFRERRRTISKLKQHKDFISQLPENISLKILSYLSPKELVEVSRVSKSWRRLTNHNSLWEEKCREVKLEVPVSDNPIWKRVFRDNVYLKINWNSGDCRITDFKGHTQSVFAVTLSGDRLASGGADKTVRVWDIRTGEQLQAKVWDVNRCLLLTTLYGHNAAIFAVDMNESGSLVITGSADRSVRMWATDTGKCTKVIWVSQTTSIMSVSYSHGYVACAYGSTICLYHGSKLIKTFNEHRKRVETVKLRISNAETGEGMIVSGGRDALVKYWDTTKDESVQTFSGHSENVNCLHIDELRIASASYDHKIRLWDFNI